MNKRETILFSIFLGVVFIIAFFLVHNQFKNKQNTLNKKLSDLELQWLEIKELIKSKSNITKINNWIIENAPKFKNEKISDEELFNFIQNISKKYNLKILSQKLLEQKQNEHLKISGIKLKIECSYQDMLKWLFELQGNSNFIMIKNIYIKPNTNDKISNLLICEIELVKFFLISKPQNFKLTTK